MPSRSKRSRGKDSNTAYPSPSSAVKWMVVQRASDYTEDEIIALFQKITKYYIFQLEEGGKTHYLHYQCYIELKVKKHKGYIQQYLPNAHLEKVRNEEAVKNYSGKEATRIGKVHEWKQPKYPGIKIISDDKLYKWQTELLKKLSEEPDDRKIMWYWSTNGKKGKSQFAKYLIVKHDAVVIGNKANDIYYCITSLEPKPKIIIMDLARCITPEKVTYEAVENVKNGFFFSGKYESQQTVMNSPHIVIFSNYAPIEEILSSDKWEVVCID